ncbi:unnamed protein product [Lepidochelys olivacea]
MWRLPLQLASPWRNSWVIWRLKLHSCREYTVRLDLEAIEDLMKQSYSASACVDVSCSVPDLAPALRDIQIESEGIAAKNLQEIDEWYKTRFLDFNQPSTKHAENLRRFREEIGNCKRSEKTQTLQEELKAMKEKIALHLCD